MGLLTDLLGGAAMSAHDVLQRQNKAEEEEALIRARSEEAEKRSFRLEELRSELQLRRDRTIQDLKDEREQVQQKRLIDDTMKAQSRSEEIGSDRRFSQFKKDGLAAGYFEGMSDDEIKGVFKEQYDDRRVTAETGGDRYQDKGQSTKAGDFLKAAQETGNTGLIGTALKGVTEARQSDAAAAKQLSEERRLALAAEKQEKWFEIQERLTDIREAASEKRASADKAVAVVDSARKFLSDQYSDLKAREKALGENLSLSADARAKAIADMQAERADLDKKSKQLDVYFERLFSGEGRLSGKSDSPASSQSGQKEPQGKAYGGVNPDGSVRYKPASGSFTDQKTGKQYPVVDMNAGKSDAVEIIRKEYEKAVASGNAADVSALARELKRLGVNVSNEPSQSNPSGGQSNRIVSIKRVG